jgi:hypothetical protein
MTERCIGFAPTLHLRPVFKPVPIPGYLYLHGFVRDGDGIEPRSLASVIGFGDA